MMIKFKVYPLVYSRTAISGFHLDFLVRPENFSEADIKWGREFVVPALTKADLLHENSRFCGFQNQKYIIIGLCSMASFLWEDKTYHLVDQNRSNYGFFGYVFPKEEYDINKLLPKIDSENMYELFCPLYKYVIEHWNDKSSESYLSPYYEINCEEISSTEERQLTILSRGEEVAVLSQKDGFAQYPQIIYNGFSFCFNMPTINDAVISLFDYVSIPTNNREELIKRDSFDSRDFTSTRKGDGHLNPLYPSQITDQVISQEEEEIEIGLNQLSEGVKNYLEGTKKILKGTKNFTVGVAKHGYSYFQKDKNAKHNKEQPNIIFSDPTRKNRKE